MAFGRRGRGAHRRSARAKLDATVPWEEPKRPEAPPTTGPWDLADLPEDGIQRIDLGALRIPIVPAMQGMELRVDVALGLATLSQSAGQMQLRVYAAPRTEGIWGEVRKEILAQIASQGGTGQQTPGTFGPEITARLPVQGGSQPARYLGVDGPRWFLQALVTGPAATDPQRAAVFEEVLRQTAVVRGDAPMPVREPLPLRLPPDLAAQVTAQAEAPQGPSQNGARPQRRRQSRAQRS